MRSLFHGSNRRFDELLRSEFGNPNCPCLTEDADLAADYALAKVQRTGEGEPWLYEFLVADQEAVRIDSHGVTGWMLNVDKLIPVSRQRLTRAPPWVGS